MVETEGDAEALLVLLDKHLIIDVFILFLLKVVFFFPHRALIFFCSCYIYVEWKWCICAENRSS